MTETLEFIVTAKELELLGYSDTVLTWSAPDAPFLESPGQRATWQAQWHPPFPADARFLLSESARLGVRVYSGRNLNEAEAWVIESSNANVGFPAAKAFGRTHEEAMVNALITYVQKLAAK